MERDGDEGPGELVPGWQVDEDDQIVVAGVAVLVLVVLGFGWLMWRGSDDPGDPGDPGDGMAAAMDADGDRADGRDEADADLSATATTVGPASSSTPTTGSAPSTSTTEVAAAVDGVTEVRNGLELLEPPAVTALEAVGVVEPGVAGVGTELTVRGVLQSEEDRAATLEAVAALPGVTSVVDRLTVSVAADLNALPQVQFATGSARIPPVSFADLDGAAALITGAGDVELRVDGWTDTRGDAEANLALSQARAEAVVAYLVEAGVDAERLVAVGNGETDRFAAGETDEALASNRVVRFVQAG